MKGYMNKLGVKLGKSDLTHLLFCTEHSLISHISLKVTAETEHYT